jgi:hypothetical protein
MSTSRLSKQKLFGLFELDQAGNVLYSRIEPEGSPAFTDPNVSGNNFFEEVAPFENVEESRQRIGNFTRSHGLADNFNFICHYENGPQPVKVLLARIGTRSNSTPIKSVLVHIRKA